MTVLQKLTQELGIKPWQAENTIKLLDEGCTVPFIARYRKEATGSLDDGLLRDFSKRLQYLRRLDEMREKIRLSIKESGALTDELSAAIDSASVMTELEDIYRPFKKKKKTRASLAREKGLEPLANLIYAQRADSKKPLELAADFINTESGVNTAEEALCGACDIIAERISDDAGIRKRMRSVCSAHGILRSKAAKTDVGVYEMYADYSEALSKIPNHRVLAVNRGESEGFLKVSVDFDSEKAMFIISRDHIKNNGSPCTAAVMSAAQDAYTRLIFPSIEREMRAQLTARACEDAIKVFSQNLRQLLMQPPVKNCVTMGLDPGYRTGCKVAVVDANGRVLDTGVIYPAPPHNKTEEAKAVIKNLIKKYDVKVFAVGNGTAGHETEVFISEVIRETDPKLGYMTVSEAGASVYSASALAAEEFPEFDVSLRSAISIARRLQDPLSELVKIDPKAIGVGQYQHDMPQARLSEALDGVVEDCVNSVGVDVNTASASLLSHVAGINKTVAGNIVSYRQINGAFASRTELKKVSGLGPKAYEQCAGFLRIANGAEPLDGTAVHPESYAAAKNLLKLFGYSRQDINKGHISDIKEKIETEGAEKIAESLKIGLPTLMDIAAYLQKPGRDPRDELPPPMLRHEIMSAADLKPGMELSGTVRNITDFGAFVDIGVHRDGLVHISQITDRFIKHPAEILKVGDIITVWVISSDAEKERISLTMRRDKVNEKG